MLCLSLSVDSDSNLRNDKDDILDGHKNLHRLERIFEGGSMIGTVDHCRMKNFAGNHIIYLVFSFIFL